MYNDFKQIEKLDINITHACNLKCSFCYDAHSNIHCMDFKAELIDELLNFINHLPKLRAITMLGGEISIRWDLTYHIVERIFNETTFKKRITLFSNGLILTDKMLSDIKKYDGRINIYNSFMPIRHIYNKYKGFSDNSTYFDTMKENVQKHLNNFSDKHDYKIMLTLTNDEINYMSELVLNAYKLEVLEVQCYFVKGAEFTDKEFELIEHQYNIIYDFLMKNKQFRFDPFMNASPDNKEQLDQEYNAYKNNVSTIFCGSGKWKYVIDTDGSIYPCECLVMKPFKVGELFHEPNKNYYKFLNNNSEKCGTCKERASCKHCIGHSMRLTGTAFNTVHENVCKANSLLFKYKKRMFKDLGYDV